MGGVLAWAQPKLTLGAVVAVGLVLLLFRVPAVAIAILIFLTSVLPYQTQNQLGIGGGSHSPGLLLSDVLLFPALGWAVLALAGLRLGRREFRFVVGVFVLLIIAALAFVHGVRAGNNLSQAGQEFRVLSGLALFLVALPLLSDRRTRRQLMIGLLAAGLTLGAWGIVQWFGHIQLGQASDFGVRQGVRLTSAGSGQLQGGEYAFPVVIVMCFAVLVSRSVRGRATMAALMLTLALNVVSCILTFERSFWLDTLLGIGVVLVSAPGWQRIRFLLTLPFFAAVFFVTLATLAPKQLTTAGERLLSLGQYANDDSVKYRLVESHFVIQRIRAHPIEGSGLGATIFWGQPWAQVPPKSYTFSHDGYLWLAWRLGLPAAALLVLLIGIAILGRGPPDRDPFRAAVRRGAQGALAGLMLATATFPSFSALSITCVMGVLLALAVNDSRRPVESWSRWLATSAAA